MSPPWMPLNIGDYRKDTAHLGAAEHGAYLLLIMHYWQTGGLPDDDRQLARISCMSDREWKKARPLVAGFFRDGWKHKRIDKELSHAHEVISKRRAAANQRYNKSDANAGPIADANADTKGGDTRVPPEQEPKSSVAIATGGEPPPHASDRELLFLEGKPALMAMGVSERQSGAILGRWLRDAADDATRVLGAVREARDRCPMDPIPWITAALKPENRNGTGPRKHDLAGAFDRLDERLGTH